MHFPFNRAGGRTSNIRHYGMKINLAYPCIAIALLSASCADNPRKGAAEPTPVIAEPVGIFEQLLSSGAPRSEVEMIAALGPNYRNRPNTSDPAFIQSAKESLEVDGRFPGSPYGNQLYRVKKMEEAEILLRGTWPPSLFNNELQALFRKYPYASLAIMEGDDQRLFFFDGVGKFVASYPR